MSKDTNLYLTKNPNGKIGVVATASLSGYVEETESPISIFVTNNLTNNTALPGQLIVYTIQISNNSPSPTSLAIETTSNVPGFFDDTKCTMVGPACYVPLGTINPNESASLVIQYAVDATATPGTYQTTFTAISQNVTTASLTENITIASS